MKYWYQAPHKQLSGYVRTVLVLEGFSQPGPGRVPLFTNGMPTLFCKTERDETGNEKIVQLSMFGKSTTADCWELNNKSTIIAYFFHPFTLACIFNVAAAKLVKEPMDLCNWNAHKTNALHAQLIYSGSTSRKVEVLDHLLISQVKENKKQFDIIQYSTEQIMCDPGTEILSGIRQALKLNERTFQRTFKKYVGITANQYRRICQFQTSFSQVRSKKFNALTDVAYDNGFADQSHFIRAFKEFTQVTPNDYLKDGLKKNNQ